jgi:aldehyde dehydrogenase (NAD+)
MYSFQKLYINGQWLAPLSGQYHEISNPATENICARTPLANENDVIAAIEAARRAFSPWTQTSAEERADFINAAADAMERRIDEFANAISETMGCPLSLAADIQVKGAIDGFRSFATLASMMEEVEEKGGFKILHEAVGVCTLINPWNYPLAQLAGKLGPALAAGCTVIVKPAEQTPIQDYMGLRM